MYAVIKRITLFTTMVVGISIMAQPNDWNWFYFNNNIAGVLHYCLNAAGDSVLSVGNHGVYAGAVGNVANRVIDPGDFVYIEFRPSIVKMPNGTIFVLGSQSSGGYSYIFRYKSLSAQPERLDSERMDGADIGLIGNNYNYTVIDSSTIRFGNVFSFNSGKTWYNMTNREVLSGSPAFTQRFGDSVYVKDNVTDSWFVVDTAARRYVPTTTLGADISTIALLPDGSGMAVRCVNGDETDLLVRYSASNAWQSVPDLLTLEGDTIKPRYNVYGRTRYLTNIGQDKVSFFLDSGRVIEFDGTSVTIRRLSPTIIPGRISRNFQYRRNGEEHYCLVYQGLANKKMSTVLLDYSLSAGTVSIADNLPAIPIDISERGYLLTGPYFADWLSRIQRPALRLPPDAVSTEEQWPLTQIVLAGQTPVMVTSANQIFVLDSSTIVPLHHPIMLTGTFTTSTDATKVLDRQALLGLTDTSFVCPSKMPTQNTLYGTLMQFPPITPTAGLDNSAGTCAAYDAAGRLLIGGNVLLRHNGIGWDSLQFPERFTDSSVVMSSIIARGQDTIIAAARGYSIGSKVSNALRHRRGGIVITMNSGETWAELPLPLTEQWVESLTQAPDGSLYCWATSMVFDQDYGTPNNPQPRYGSARIYRSTNMGITWTEQFIDDADDDLLRSAVVHQWSISFHPSGYTAISTPKDVFVAESAKAPFTKFTDLPVDIRIGGCVIDPDGVLWIAGTRGLHRRVLPITSVKEEIAQKPVLVAEPNPAHDVITIRVLNSAIIETLPDVLTVYTANGTSVLQIPQNGTAYMASCQQLAPGYYIARGMIGTTLVRIPLCVLR